MPTNTINAGISFEPLKETEIVKDLVITEYDADVMLKGMEGWQKELNWRTVGYQRIKSKENILEVSFAVSIEGQEIKRNIICEKKDFDFEVTNEKDSIVTVKLKDAITNQKSTLIPESGSIYTLERKCYEPEF
jgi:hypothetical protein